MLDKMKKLGAKITKFFDDLYVSIEVRKALNDVIEEMKKEQKVRFEKGEKLGGGVARSEYKVKRDARGRFVKWEKIK